MRSKDFWDFFWEFFWIFWIFKGFWDEIFGIFRDFWDFLGIWGFFGIFGVFCQSVRDFFEWITPREQLPISMNTENIDEVKRLCYIYGIISKRKHATDYSVRHSSAWWLELELGRLMKKLVNLPTLKNISLFRITMKCTPLKNDVGCWNSPLKSRLGVLKSPLKTDVGVMDTPLKTEVTAAGI